MSTRTPFRLELPEGVFAGERITAGTPGHVLVLVHGAGHDHRIFDRFLESLHDVDAIAVDLPGRASAGAEPKASAEEAARVIDAGLRALLPGRTPVALGHSYGGAVAIELALVRPLAGLVLVSTGARLRVRPEVLAIFREVAEGGAPRPAGLGWSDRADARLREAHEAAFAAIPAATALADWSAADRFDRMSDLSRVVAPSLAIVGTDDDLTPPKYAAYLGAHLPRCHVEVLDGAGHLAIAEEAPRVAALVREWLEALP